MLVNGQEFRENAIFLVYQKITDIKEKNFFALNRNWKNEKVREEEKARETEKYEKAREKKRLREEGKDRKRTRKREEGGRQDEKQNVKKIERESKRERERKCARDVCMCVCVCIEYKCRMYVAVYFFLSERSGEGTRDISGRYMRTRRTEFSM